MIVTSFVNWDYYLNIINAWDDSAEHSLESKEAFSALISHLFFAVMLEKNLTLILLACLKAEVQISKFISEYRRALFGDTKFNSLYALTYSKGSFFVKEKQLDFYISSFVNKLQRIQLQVEEKYSFPLFFTKKNDDDNDHSYCDGVVDNFKKLVAVEMQLKGLKCFSSFVACLNINNAAFAIQSLLFLEFCDNEKDVTKKWLNFYNAYLEKINIALEKESSMIKQLQHFCTTYGPIMTVETNKHLSLYIDKKIELLNFIEELKEEIHNLSKKENLSNSKPAFSPKIFSPLSLQLPPITSSVESLQVESMRPSHA